MDQVNVHWNGYLAEENAVEVAEVIRSILGGKRFACAYTNANISTHQPILAVGLSLRTIEPMFHASERIGMTIYMSNEQIDLWFDQNPVLHCSEGEVTIIHQGHSRQRIHRVYKVWK